LFASLEGKGREGFEEEKKKRRKEKVQEIKDNGKGGIWGVCFSS